MGYLEFLVHYYPINTARFFFLSSYSKMDPLNLYPNLTASFGMKWHLLAQNCVFWYEMASFGMKRRLLVQKWAFWNKMASFGKTLSLLVKTSELIFFSQIHLQLVQIWRLCNVLDCKWLDCVYRSRQSGFQSIGPLGRCFL